MRELLLTCRDSLMLRDGSGERFVSRIHLDCWVRDPYYDGRRCSTKYQAVIDTGAEASLIPMSAVLWFKQKDMGLKVGEAGSLTTADGTTHSDVPSYAVDFVFRANEPRDHLQSEGKGHAITVDTHDHYRGRNALYVYALEMPPDKEIVLIGMDVLRHWRLDLDGPGRRHVLLIPNKHEIATH